MQATTATFLAGGSGRLPLSNFSAYASLFLRRSSVLLMRLRSDGGWNPDPLYIDWPPPARSSGPYACGMVDEADELYGLPDDEFTAARDALAKRLRGEKRREDADAVKALRRPSVAAGAINRAVREHGADEVLAAGDALRSAHEALLAGGGDAARVREAMARERDAVRDFTRLALGEGASDATEEKVRATLHAASVDDDVREALMAGRLEREAEAGADPMALLAASAGRAGGKRARSAPRTAT